MESVMKKVHYHRLYIWFISVCSILSISWIGDLIAGGEMFVWFTDLINWAVPPLHPYVIGKSGVLAGLLCLIVMSVYFTNLVYRQGQEWFRPIASVKQAKNNQVKALMLNVSMNDLQVIDKGGKGADFLNLKTNKIDLTLEQVSLEEDNILIDQAHKEADEFLLNWQPILRSIALNREGLKHICLIYTTSASGEENIEKGTISKREGITNWLKGYSELKGIEIHSHEISTSDIDIEKFYASYCDAIEILEEKGIDASDIVVSVTGGTVDMSIAASMATLHKKTRFEYVSQIDRKLYKYNLAIQRPMQ